jgi:hypothetical protein
MRTFGNPIPEYADITFRYADRINIDAGGSGATSLYQFSANGMYDPDITGTGHQPLGFDQWMGTSSTTGFYNHYMVVSSEIHVTAFSQVADNTGQAIIFLGLSDDTTVSVTDANTLLENPTWIHTPLGALSGGHDVATLSLSFDSARYFGLTGSSLYAKDDLKGIYSANPNEQGYFSLCVTSNNITVNPSNISLLVEIVYHAHLTERREILGS